jgi:hypothetical protein
MLHQPDQNRLPELSELAAVRMREQAWGEDFQRESQVAPAGQGGSRGDECVRLFLGEQVQSRRPFFLAARVEPPAVNGTPR